MISPHADPNKHGHRFGAVVVTIDFDAFDCILRTPQPSKGPVATVEKSARFHSLDEIRAAWQTQNWLSRKPALHPHAFDMACALKFAGQCLKNHQERKRRD